MADDEHPSSLTDRLRDALAAVPARRHKPASSQLREQVRALFDRLTADRDRGATWEGLAVPFAALGVTTAQGRPPTGLELRNAYHAERYARGGERRQQRGPKKRDRGGQKATAEAAPEPFRGAGELLPAGPARRRLDLSEPSPVAPGLDDSRRSREEAGGTC